MLQLEKPKIRPEIPIVHKENGGLSTVTTLPGSSEPKNSAFQSHVPACTAIA